MAEDDLTIDGVTVKGEWWPDPLATPEFVETPYVVTAIGGRTFTDYERRLVETYFLCECGSPRAPRWMVKHLADGDTLGLECLWNGHGDED